MAKVSLSVVYYRCRLTCNVNHSNLPPLASKSPFFVHVVHNPTRAIDESYPAVQRSSTIDSTPQEIAWSRGVEIATLSDQTTSYGTFWPLVETGGSRWFRSWTLTRAKVGRSMWHINGAICDESRDWDLKCQPWQLPNVSLQCFRIE